MTIAVNRTVSEPGADAGAALAAALTLMPMHLLLDEGGGILSVGATLRRVVGSAERFDDAFELLALSSIAEALRAERVMLRSRGDDQMTLRGRAVAVPVGILFNLGFGIGVIEAIRTLGLTDQDFAPSELAMEMLFLHEANNAMTEELGRANITLEEARSKAEAEAFTDPLTGLYNRRGLELSFAALHQAVQVDPSLHFAVVALDLDRFKQLNDTLGHAAGDEMLRTVAARLRSITRDEDTLSRVGGDEFLLLLPHVADAEQLLTLGQRIIEAIEQPVEIEGHICRISASVGCALSITAPEPDWPILEAAADKALYSAKRAGRGRTRLAWQKICEASLQAAAAPC